MPKKTMGTVQDLRTAQKARLRSKPRTKGQEFLDLYILAKQKDRFEREQERVADGLKYVLKDMEEVSKDVEKAWAADKEAIEKLAGKTLGEIRKEPEAPKRRPVGRKPFRPRPIEY